MREKVQDAVGTEGKVVFTTISKNNGTVKEGLSIETKMANKIPVIGIRDIYERYRTGSSMEECVAYCRKAMDQRANINISELWGMWKEQKKQIKPCLVNGEWNQERLKEIPHFSYGDLAVKFRVEYKISNELKAGYDVTYDMLRHWGISKNQLVETIPHFSYGDLAVKFRVEYKISNELKAGYDVTYDMLRHWGISKNQLVETVMQNLRQEKYTIRDLQEVLGEQFGLPMEEERKGAFYLLTNDDQIYGAAGMLRTDLLEHFAEERGCDFYILPSSVHELLLIVDSGEITKEELEEMVRSVNRMCVAKEERLSDRVYYFKRGSGKAELAA